MFSAGIFTIIAGFIGVFVLLLKFTKPGLLESKGSLSEVEFYIIFGVLSYHLLIGWMCIEINSIKKNLINKISRSSVEDNNNGKEHRVCSKCGHTSEGIYCEQCGFILNS